MNQETQDKRFERDLRSMLLASEPADVPASLYRLVDAIPRPEPAVLAPRPRGWDRRALAVLAAAAVLAIVAVGIVSGIVRLPGILPLIGGPSEVPGAGTYRLYYEVTPLDRHEPTPDELGHALEVLRARVAAYQGAATGEVLAGIPNTVAVDVVLPSDDPRRLADLRAVLPMLGGVVIGTVADGTVDVGESANDVAFEPAFGNGAAFIPSLRADGTALDIAIGPEALEPFEAWTRAQRGRTAVVTTQEGVVLALAPIAPLTGASWAISFTPDQVAAGVPRKLLALFGSPSMRNPVREVAPRGVALAPGIIPEPVPTPSPTVAPGNQLHLEYGVADVALADEALAVLERRLTSLGITGYDRSITPDGRILLELPVARDDEAAYQPLRLLLGSTGKLDFVPLGEAWVVDGDEVDLVAHPALISTGGVADVSVAYDQTGARAIQITFTPDAAATFATWTANHVGEYLAIVSDGSSIAVPLIAEPITDGVVLISSPTPDGWTEREAQRLAAILGSGEVPTSITERENNIVEAAATASPTAAPTTLSVAGYVAACPAIAGCVYDLDLRSAGAEWRAALTPDANGQLTAGAGLPATLEPGDYTVTATARRNPDSIAGGMGDQGPVDATCTANFTVAAGDDVLVVSATFDAGVCEVSAGVPR